MNIKLSNQTYVLGPKLYTLGASDYYPTQYVNAETESKTPKKEMTVFDRLLEDDPLESLPGIVKIVRDPNDNDLLANEQKVLNGLYVQINHSTKNAWVSNCIPEIVEMGTHDKRIVTVFRARPQHVSFERLLQLFPKGLDYLDVVWMWKRFLATLWFVHRQGIVHGGCLPPHLLVHPTEHGPQLIEWSYATQHREHLKAMVSEYQPFYPPEVLRRQEVRPSLDMFMLAKCVVVLLGGNVNTNEMPDSVPVPFQKLVLDCLPEAPSERTEDAGVLHEALDQVLASLVGGNKYRPLRLPTILAPRSDLMSYEAHITFERDVFQRLEPLIKDNELLQGWKLSQIDGDPVLGKKVYGYFTAHHTNYDPLMSKVQATLEYTRSLGCPPVRAKIEKIMYDEKFV